VEEQAFFAAAAAHADANVPVITMDCGALCEATLGELFGFWQLCCSLSAATLGEDPQIQTGLEPFRANLAQLLGDPGVSSL
jgi:hypothetical protein